MGGNPALGNRGATSSNQKANPSCSLQGVSNLETSNMDVPSPNQWAFPNGLGFSIQMM